MAKELLTGFVGRRPVDGHLWRECEMGNGTRPE
jgi:hypothetical protein